MGPVHQFAGNLTRWARVIRFAAAALVVAVACDLVFGRPWRQHWGASPGEIARTMPGDDRVASPDEITTRAITIRARPDQIYPWLAQMGRGRGGLYSYDGLDRLFGVLDRPSAQQLLPQFQRLEPGDTIPVGGSAGWPVAIATPGKVLLLDVDERGTRVTWVFTLEPTASSTTRLVTRVRGRLPWSWAKPILLAVLDHAEFIMVRQQLLNLRERAERVAGTR